MVTIKGLFHDDDHVITESKGIFSVVEHQKDLTTTPEAAMREYFMSQMDIKRKQLLATLDGTCGVTTQAGSMQWMAGDVRATTGIKGAGDLVGKMFKSALTHEGAIKPEYQGTGYIMLEPTYKYLLLEDVSEWEGGLVMEDGLFLACESTVKLSVQSRKSVSSAVLGKEGLFNLRLDGNGVCALESNVNRKQLIEIILENDTLKIDGSLAICWSGSLDFTVERAGKTLVGSAASGEGLVNVYRGTGRVLLAPLEERPMSVPDVAGVPVKEPAPNAGNVPK